MATKNSYCVVKQLDPATENPEAYKTALNLFNREAKTLAKLEHVQIPKLLNYFEENQQFYLIQEFILGKNLERVVRKGHIYQESSAKKFLRSMLPVLKYIHSQKVIHRDIKPGNILREKKTNKLYLIDFGAVKEQVNTQLMNENPEGAFTKISVGTMGFAPPEQLAMRPVYSSDIYALAATCIFLLTGKAPKDLCDSVTGELAWEQHTTVTPTFARVLNKMLELDVRKRFNSADEVIKALDLVPYEEELAGSLVNLKGAKETLTQKPTSQTTIEEDDTTISNSTSQNLADAIRRRREKLSNKDNNKENIKKTKLPPSGNLVSQPKQGFTRELIIDYYRQGNRNFSQQTLNGFNLGGLKLAGASFSQSKLIGSHLEKANFYRTNFYNANLAQANLKEANLRKAELYKANLKSADLQGANLTKANLADAILKDANLSGANLSGAKVTEEQIKSAKTNWRTIFPDGKRRWW
jgi:serine/threonine-protein kinase